VQEERDRRTALRKSKIDSNLDNPASENTANTEMDMDLEQQLHFSPYYKTRIIKSYMVAEVPEKPMRLAI
ncbi:MAG: hypothetical protein HYZ43_06420, partial [Flavobacteriia bacterium]|nr:hypothetical protein [Flavobacteriia bacterium]